MSIPGDLVLGTLERIVSETDVTEVTAADGGAFLSLRSEADGSPAGQVRRFEGERLARVVYCTLDLPAFGLESHMIYAFAPAGSGVPHFTVDCADMGGTLAFHDDLMPRVDLATHVAYTDAVFTPLDPTFAHVGEHPEVFLTARLTPRQRSLMSPWMLANRFGAADAAEVTAANEAYLDRWLELVVKGLPPEAEAAVAGDDLAARDAVMRKSVFGGDVDPAWDMAAKAVGAEPIRVLRGLLVG